MSQPLSWPSDLAGLLPEGTTLKGEYRLTGYLGAGAFGAVYAADQLTINRRVAVKVLQAGNDDTARERFLQEARVAASIDHPNIVTIFDYGVIDGKQPFIVMELLKGHDLLHELEARGPMSPARALPLFISCLDALGEAHRLGIVHKDLKPSNLFLAHPSSHREVIKILDFGIARVGLASSERVAGAPEQPPSGGITATGQAIGTPQYLAPEYVEKQIVSPALDVYQMGLILAEALTGRPAVDGNSWWSCALKHLRGELDLPPSLMDTPLGPVILKATARKPEDRYPDAHAFLGALRALPNPNRPAPTPTATDLPPALNPPLGRPPVPTLEERPPGAATPEAAERSASQPPDKVPTLQEVARPEAQGQAAPRGPATAAGTAGAASAAAGSKVGAMAIFGGVLGIGGILALGGLALVMLLMIPMCSVCKGNPSQTEIVEAPLEFELETPVEVEDRQAESALDPVRDVRGQWRMDVMRNPPPGVDVDFLVGSIVTIERDSLTWDVRGNQSQLFYTVTDSNEDSVELSYPDGTSSSIRFRGRDRIRITDNTLVGSVMDLTRVQ